MLARTSIALSSSLLALSLVACGGGEKVDALAMDQGTASLDTMAGTEWVYLEEVLSAGVALNQNGQSEARVEGV